MSLTEASESASEPERIHRPDYRGGGIVNLMSSIVRGLGGQESLYPSCPALPPARLRAPRSVALLVIDGLGYEFLQRHGQGTRLLEHTAARLSSVFPSTTATAITSFLTGTAPQQHGLTGWHMYLKELGCVMAVLPGQARFGGGGLSEARIEARQLLSHRSIFERIAVQSYSVVPAHIARSDFNIAHQGPAELRSYQTLDEYFGIIERLLRQGNHRQFVYAYWPELDRLAHEHGTASPQVLAHLKALDAAFARFLDRIAGSDALIALSADHGFIDTPPEHAIELDDHPRLRDTLLLPLCGERRAAYCYVGAERRADFEAYIHNELGHGIELRRTSELIEQGWFGLGEPHPRLRERAGDYVLLMKDDYIIKDWLVGERRYSQIGVHGGVSSAEMFVPLILAEA
ncbi:MAG: alkaline phosphatase family protein [Chromatiales bacterium]|jgi:hypothetical protein